MGCAAGDVLKRRVVLHEQVDQPFDEGKFNFKKALQQEVLFQFDASSPGGLTYSASAPVSKSPNLVFINISPIEYGHVLLVPRVLDCLNQVSHPFLPHGRPRWLTEHTRLQGGIII